MIKTKFVFAVSLVAMLAVGSAWANKPVGDDSVDTAHTVYTDQSPTSTEVEGGTAIAGVTYVNRAVNKAGASATAAEAHAAAAGASALAAQKSADEAAKKANDALADKQDKLTTTNIKGSGSVTVGISNGVITVSGTDNNTTYSTGTATSSGLTKLYTGTGTNTDGTMTQAALKTALDGKLSTSGTAAKATADASGNTITTTYEKLSNKYMTTTTGIEITNDNKDTYYPSIGKVQSMIDDTEQYVDDQIAAYDQGLGETLDNLTNTKQDKLTEANVTTTGTGNVVTAVSASGGKVTVTKGVSVNNATLTIKNGATSEDLATFTANSSTGATATIPAASATVAGLAKIGVIPSGYETASEYAAIWVE